MHQADRIRRERPTARAVAPNASLVMRVLVLIAVFSIGRCLARPQGAFDANSMRPALDLMTSLNQLSTTSGDHVSSIRYFGNSANEIVRKSTPLESQEDLQAQINESSRVIDSIIALLRSLPSPDNHGLTSIDASNDPWNA